MAEKGWEGLPAVSLDGKNWTLDIAAGLLGVPERDLRDLVRITGLRPAGTAGMRPYRSQGRAARLYPGRSLILLAEGIARLREAVNFPE